MMMMMPACWWGVGLCVGGGEVGSEWKEGLGWVKGGWVFGG